MENDWLEDFCSQELLTKRGLSSVTVNNYRRVLKRFLSDRSLAHQTPQAALQYLSAMRQRNVSHSHFCNTAIAIERYLSFRHQTFHIARPRKPQPIIPHTLSEGEMARLIAATQNIREKAIVSLLAYTGLRNRELCTLKTQDVDMAQHCLRVIGGKFSKSRLVYLAKECVSILAEYLAQWPRVATTWLFTTLRHSVQYTGWALRRLIHLVAKRAKITKRVYPHLLRHSFATNLLRRGANLVTIQRLLGHANIQTTMLYAHASPYQIQQEYHFYMPQYA